MPKKASIGKKQTSMEKELEDQVEKFIIKLNRQNNEEKKKKRRRSASKSVTSEESKHTLNPLDVANQSYLSRLVTSPFLPKISRPKTIAGNSRIPLHPRQHSERRAVSAGSTPSFSSNNRGNANNNDSNGKNTAFKNLSMSYEKYNAPPRTPPAEWGFANSADEIDTMYNPPSSASSSSMFSRPSTAPLSLQNVLDHNRPATSPIKPTYDIKQAKKDDDFIRQNATLTPLRLDQMKMGSNVSRQYLAARKHAKDQLGLKTLLQIGQKNHAAVIIQSLYRMYVIKLLVWGPKGVHQQYSATKIQSVFRGFASRHREELDLKAKRHLSSIVIQTYYRRKVAMNLLITMLAKRQESAVALINRMMRGAIARRYVKRKIFNMRKNAATLIQTQWRRYITNTMYGVVQQRRKERAIQRRAIKLYRTGIIEKAHFKDPDDELMALKYALGLIVIDRKEKAGKKVLRQTGEHGRIQKLIYATIGLGSNLQVEKHLGILSDSQINKNNDEDYNSKKNSLIKEKDDKLIEMFSTLSRDMILGWVCNSPTDTAPLIYYTITLLIQDFIVHKNIRNSTENYVQRLIDRIGNTPLAMKMKDQIDNLKHIFNTWFLTEKKLLTDFVVEEEEDDYSSSNNSNMIGETIRIFIKQKDWLMLKVISIHKFWPVLVVKLSNDFHNIMDIKNLAVKLCSQVRAIKTGVNSYRMVIPHIEHTKQLRFYFSQKNKAAMIIQRNFNAFMKEKQELIRNNTLDIISKQEKLLDDKLMYRDNIRERRHELVSKVKASFIGHRTRTKLETLHAAAIQCQKIIRGMLGKLRFEEEKNWQLYGAQILTMFERGRCVSGTFLLLQVYRSGYNYLIRGNDFEGGCTYQGLVRDEHVRALVRCHPYGRDSLYSLTRAPKLRIWHYNRITALLIKCLALTDPIHGLGELNEYDGNKVMICDIQMKAKAHGPSILSRSGLRRILFDTKDIVFPPEGSYAWKQRRKQRILMEKRKRAKTAPAKSERGEKGKTEKRPKTTV